MIFHGFIRDAHGVVLPSVYRGNRGRKRRDKFTSRLVGRLDTDTGTCKTAPATRVRAR